MSKVKHKRPATRLWHVYGDWRGCTVSAKPLRIGCCEYRRIRACTAKAAGRRWIRNNLATMAAGQDHETDNPNGGSYFDMRKEWPERAEYKRLVKMATVKVRKP